MLMPHQYYKQVGCYRRCSYGPDCAKVYAAWYSPSRFGKWINDRVCLGYFKKGTDKQKLKAAEKACEDHYYSLQKKAG